MIRDLPLQSRRLWRDSILPIASLGPTEGLASGKQIQVFRVVFVTSSTEANRFSTDVCQSLELCLIISIESGAALETLTVSSLPAI